jgi:hypothetical protein
MRFYFILFSVLVFILFLFPLRQLQCSMQHALAKAGKKVKRTQTLTNPN